MFLTVSLITFNKVSGVKMQCNPLASPQTIYCTWASLSCLARSSLVWFVLCSSMVRSSTVLSACLHCSWSLSLSWISSSSERSLSNSLPETYTHIQKTHRSWGCGYSKGFHSCYSLLGHYVSKYSWSSNATTYLSLQFGHEGLQFLHFLFLLQQGLLQLVQPHLGILTQLLLQVHLCVSLSGCCHGLTQLEMDINLLQFNTVCICSNRKKNTFSLQTFLKDLIG